MKKVILIIVDGLSYKDGIHRMAFLQHLVEYNKGSFHKVIGEIPSMSRPIYETILTGKPVHEHGIVGNDTVRLSKERNLFKIAKENGLKTAAAAYYWMSELYVKAPFNKITDRFLIDDSKDVQRGIFYFEDCYPDSHLYSDAEYLRVSYEPDFLLIHPMNVDNAGHCHSGQSSAYRNSILATDQALSKYIPIWLEAGYQIVVTADHGINDDYGHGGTLPSEREVPMWILGEDRPKINEIIGQKEIIKIISDILEIK